MPKNLSHQDLSESNTVLFLTLSAIFLSEGQIMEGINSHNQNISNILMMIKNI
jgi:hypothetical protein